MKKRRFVFLSIVLVTIMMFPVVLTAEEENTEDKEDQSNDNIPSHVLDISKENTYPNTKKDQTYLEPNDLANELIESSKVKIENPEFIKMLNESSLKPSKLAFGYRGEIYLGHWPLNYKSDESSMNWEYQEINVNVLNNLGGKEKKTLNYVQEKEKRVKGGLTSKTERAEDVKKMIQMKAQSSTDLPLAFETVIGAGTKKDQTYGVSPKNVGYLHAYAPALNEKGVVTYGEVYLILKGSKKKLEVRNVTKQGIGAWIPIQDHASFSFQLKSN
ncbi:YfkD-like protein [Salinibacillus kushneri]|uniref:YfkD-like protein n=1 Tax=Salinibacillus kushneri TaxID=237682 RepID=A0A1I0GPI3_9BACI|nr:YfkD famly protein [Salinibacillus kushneri]SET72970.1 YfkD-like protein [Salinibacillus kushneri]